MIPEKSCLKRVDTRRPHTAITSSTTSAGNTFATTPTDTTSDNRRDDSDFN